MFGRRNKKEIETMVVIEQPKKFGIDIEKAATAVAVSVASELIVSGIRTAAKKILSAKRKKPIELIEDTTQNPDQGPVTTPDSKTTE